MKVKIFIINFVIFFIIGLLIGYFQSVINDKLSIQEEVNNINNIPLCNNKTLSQTSKCLKEWVNTFYNYCYREENTIRTDEEIINGCGNCYDYSKMYQRHLNNLGFLTNTTVIRTKEKAHIFLVAWDKNFTEYCTLDQLNIDCIKLGVKNES